VRARYNLLLYRREVDVPEVRCLSINVLEAHTLDMLTGTMLDLAARRHKSGCADCAVPVTHVSEFTDNTATEHSSERGKPEEWRMHAIVQRRYEEHQARGVFTHTDRVTSVDNDVADGLSRGGSGCADALRMMASLGLDLCRVQVEPWRRSTEWMRESERSDRAPTRCAGAWETRRERSGRARAARQT